VPGLKLDHNGNFITFDFEAQCRSVFENVRAILEASGSSWDQLIDVTVFLVNMKRDFHTYNRLYAEYFKDNLPCRTTVEISSLPTPIAIELKCIATIES
jgi:2-aminomuconate deaminase